MVFGGFATPLYAGIFTFMGKIFLNGEDYTYSAKNSQNLALLSAAHNADPNPSKGGGGIMIAEGVALVADGGPVGSSKNTTAPPRGDQINVYVVREGDSLSQIAKMFDVTTETILWANDVGPKGLIKPGQTLVILPISGLTHVVKKGDTLSSIAKVYSADAEEIASFNDMLDGAKLSVGDELVIPNGKKKNTPTRRSSNKTVRSSGGPSYAGYYIRPIHGGRKSQGIHGHNAVDLAVGFGSPVFASASGEVLISRTGWNGGYGNYIVIAHPNRTQTVYAHNSRNIVYAGQSVVQGQVIGYVGSTGRSTGSHVHFEVRGAQNPF